MAKIKEKQIALALRKEHKSYAEIKRILGISKSTLSLWLRDYPLPPEKIKELRDHNAIRIERYRETRRIKREALFNQIYRDEKKKILPFSKRDIFIAGLFLYWAEGGKTYMSEPVLSNTDPAIINAFSHWIALIGFKKSDVSIRLQLYQDMNIEKEVNFWSEKLQIHKNQFTKPYIKKSNITFLTYKNGFGHGTCNMRVRSAMLGKRIAMGLKVIRDYFNGIGSVA